LDLLDDRAVGDLEPIMIDQQADAVLDGRLRLEGWSVAEQGARLLDGGVLAAR
jgi:hypothetical protein